MQDLTGQLLGRYHILKRLGEGGMATVYKAYDPHLERTVAIKIIRRDRFAPMELEHILKRFEREAKVLSRLTHPNIIPIIDYGEHEGSPYLVMPFLAGGTLKRKLVELGHPMHWQEAVRLALPIARALEFAHKRGIVHRDIKPSNILITDSGEPMLGDFGVAKILESKEAATLTRTGIAVGTPEYMAPEQGRGQSVPQSDVYGLGVVLYELITGRKPYTADTPTEVLFKHRSEPLPRPRQFVPDLPLEVEKVLFKALAKETANRYSNMGEFALALEALLLRDAPAANRGEVTMTRAAPLGSWEQAAETSGQARTSPGIGKAAIPEGDCTDRAGKGGRRLGAGVLAGMAVGLMAIGLLIWLVWKGVEVEDAKRTETAAARWEQIQRTVTSMAQTLAQTGTAEIEQARLTATAEAEQALALTATVEAEQALALTATVEAEQALALTETEQARPTATPTQMARVRDIDGMVIVYVPEGTFWRGGQCRRCPGGMPKVRSGLWARLVRG